MSNKVCANCGKKIKTTDNFCPYCGEKNVEIIKKEEVKEEKVIKKDEKIRTVKEPKNSLFMPIALTVIITLCICLLINLILFQVVKVDKSTSSNVVTTEKNVTVIDNGIADAVSKVYDAVVVIETYRNGSLYSTGTGFVFEKDDNTGYILTNNHVISNATNVYVVFTNNEKIEAKVVGSDSYSDVAVVSVDAKNILAVASIGSSENARIGDTTFAVGAPVDSKTYSWSVTRGILSGKNREVEVTTGNNLFSSSSTVMNVLQTDAAINSGNSGGPLCNANGEVIGITNMKLSSSSVEGMGFAIPIEDAIDYATKFISGEKLERPYLGIGMYFVSPTIYSDVSVTGIYISQVEDKSSASKAGLKVGDIITKINDVEITSSAYFKYQLYKYNVGDKITLTYVRNGKTKTVTIVLESDTLNN